MGILFGLSAAFFWGLGDYLITHLTRRVGTSRALLYVQVLSLLSWIIFLFATTETASPAVSTPAGRMLWFMAIATGVFHVAGLALAYRAFEVGTLSLVSPIVSGFAIVTAVLALISGEHPSALALLGAACLIVGVVLATRTPADPHSQDSAEDQAAQKKLTLKGVPEALGSALAFGIMFWMFYFFVQPKMGYVWPLIVLKIMASGSSLLSVLASRSKPAPTVAAIPQIDPATTAATGFTLQTAGVLALGAALADTLAWVAYIWGMKTQYATVVTALASLFSVITILLAWLLLRERLAKYQWAGVAIILLGVLLVSI
jgi:drug/metabolite transporter (DMT)-like permease